LKSSRGTKYFFDPEDAGRRSFQNGGTCLLEFTTSHPARP